MLIRRASFRGTTHGSRYRFPGWACRPRGYNGVGPQSGGTSGFKNLPGAS
jgi:hypothetical protein